jgi:hypothetical protein
MAQFMAEQRLVNHRLLQREAQTRVEIRNLSTVIQSNNRHQENINNQNTKQHEDLLQFLIQQSQQQQQLQNNQSQLLLAIANRLNVTPAPLALDTSTNATSTSTISQVSPSPGSDAGDTHFHTQSFNMHVDD